VFACFTRECVNSTLVIVLNSVVSGVDKLQYSVIVLKAILRSVCLRKLFIFLICGL